ncbi:hypothetical protein KBB96_05275 [Luteolibacter ambystomatis]|uniref:Uncharacterized protein n=1 Tax=Luteolibacter ambystomatis TaxID=2824561 RepID=A0A975J1H4_9BACT|nr:hypothetical protein [Luteolibacter ambystomatis]QUE52303.1 hypothetical protein KBB96_05275 [Luteolibacter ambystomatis]
MKLEFESGAVIEVQETYDLEMIKVHLGGDSSFVIMASGDDDYIQAAADKGGFFVEKRVSNPVRHFAAYLIDKQPSPSPKPKWYQFSARMARSDAELFTCDQVVALFRAYLEDAEPGFPVGWHDKSADLV